MASSVAAGAWALAVALALLASAPRHCEGAHLNEEFDAFVRAHGRSYRRGSDEYERRKALFRRHAWTVAELNSDPDRHWDASVGELADFTEGELAALRGYRPGARPRGAPAPLQLRQESRPGEELLALDGLPKDWSWKKHGLQAMRHVETQGSCGSCWAFSASTLLRAHTELYRGGDRKFSQQQILSCTRNPQKCGGGGGCSGATVELALDYVHRRGCTTPESVPYTGSDRHGCPASMSDGGGPSSGRRAAFLAQGGGARGSETGGESFGMTGYTRLPENELAPVLLALYQRGPVGVSVAAETSWNFYGRGILYACSKDAVINHAVVLVGYGEDRGKLYWTLQNSWGRRWGEDGFLRLRRHSHAEESQYCGEDRKPEQGSGCKGGPKAVTVCGSCGILNDAVVPNFRLGEGGWWSLMSRTGANATSRMVVADGSVSVF